MRRLRSLTVAMRLRALRLRRTAHGGRRRARVPRLAQQGLAGGVGSGGSWDIPVEGESSHLDSLQPLVREPRCLDGRLLESVLAQKPVLLEERVECTHGELVGQLVTQGAYVAAGERVIVVPRGRHLLQV